VEKDVHVQEIRKGAANLEEIFMHLTRQDED
jgi:hypothetical protein